MPKENKEDLENFLWDVSDEKKFYCINGSVFKNLEELEKALRDMDEDTFNYHVNEYKNDFATWIYDVIGDIKLSKNLMSVDKRKAIARKIKTRITYIKKNINNSSI
ncbi:MAG: DUF5752 family protein [Candidatus Pacearchaeota archaeon]|nr:DUF5752 family protein [Candidatus Pacearchaeota archaeon]